MIATSIGHPGKLRRRFTPEERWTYVAGVLCIAGDAPVRGCFVVDDVPASAEDLADKAGVRLSVATATLVKLRELGMLEHDEELGCERVHDWADYNPEPKADPSNALRQRRWRERNSADNAPRNRGRNAPTNSGDNAAPNAPDNGAASRALRATRPVPEGVLKLEVGSTPPAPPMGGRARDRLTYEEELAKWAAAHFPGVEAGYVKAAIGTLRRPDREPTVPEITAYLERHIGYGQEGKA